MFIGSTKVQPNHFGSRDFFTRLLEAIARDYFGGSTDHKLTDALSDACRAIYRTITNIGTWGIGSLTKLPTSGLIHDRLSPEERRQINSLPAMIYYGVRTEAAILMRMQSIPRSIAEPLGKAYLESGGKAEMTQGGARVRQFIQSLSDSDWGKITPAQSPMTGSDYKQVWRWLSGAEDHR